MPGGSVAVRRGPATLAGGQAPAGSVCSRRRRCPKKLANLEAAVAIFLAYYNFCRRTHDAVNEQTRVPTAMAAGVTDTLITFEELLDKVMGNAA